MRVKLRDLAADVLVVTEGCAELLSDGGHVIDGGADWGYRSTVDRRKVLVWSRTPWTAVKVATEGACRGRVMIGRTPTALGEIEVIGVCIPWRDAHVRGGRCDANHGRNTSSAATGSPDVRSN